MSEDKKLLSKRKKNIAKVGAELFSKKGYTETSMEDIATAAKLSKGGIYHYFPSKAEVLYFILDNFMDIILKDLQEELDQIDDGLEKLRTLISRHIDLYPKHMAEARTMWHMVPNLPPKYFRKIVAKEREYFHILANVLRVYLGPSVEKSQVTAMTFLLLGMCNSIYAWYNPKSPVATQQLSHMMFDILMEGITGIQKKTAPARV